MSLFSCGELTSLLLQGCDIPPLPEAFKGFPNLTHLYFSAVTFPIHGETTLEALIARSPSLHSLYILALSIARQNGGHFDEWVIRAPKLKLLHLTSGEDYGWQIEDFPSLEEAHISLHGPQLARILSGLTRVKKLSVSGVKCYILISHYLLQFFFLRPSCIMGTRCHRFFGFHYYLV